MQASDNVIDLTTVSDDTLAAANESTRMNEGIDFDINETRNGSSRLKYEEKPASTQPDLRGVSKPGQTGRPVDEDSNQITSNNQNNIDKNVGEGIRQRAKRVRKPVKRPEEIFEGPQHLSRPSRTRRKEMTMARMRDHLENVFIGLQPGDPTVREVERLKSDDIVGIAATEFVTIDLSQFRQSELLEMAKATEISENMPAVLSKRPGVRKDKLATFTGQNEFYASLQANPNQNNENRDARALADALKKCFKKKNNFKAWELLGFDSIPIVGWVAVPLRKLCRLVRDEGGYQTATDEKRWSYIARQIGVAPESAGKNGHKCRVMYKDHILKLEKYLKDMN